MALSQPDRPIILSIDQGTTSTRAVAFTADGQPVATAQEPFKQIYPQDGWVEHDPDDIWNTVYRTVGSVIEHVGGVECIAAIGITNQRETTLIWDKASGKPVYNAIVWQDRRGAALCRDLVEAGHAKLIQDRTGLIPDSYFSATKVKWILDSDPDLRARAERGDLAFGTVDTFLLWRLTGGAVHATDATNASRTMLYDIHRQQWDDDLLELFGVPSSTLPDVRDTADQYGNCSSGLFGAPIPVSALVGDQQGAVAGQNCFKSGLTKCTFGTGAFVLLNTGAQAPKSENKLVGTVAYRLAGETTYALEGSVFNAGTVVQWLRDEMGLLTSANESEKAASAASETPVTFVPAFTGLGAPHWNPDARGAIFGLTRDTTAADVVRAGLEAVCHQTCDLLDAMAADTGQTVRTLRVDGGMAANNWMLQTLADLSGTPVERPAYLETTVWGAAVLAGLSVGVYDSVANTEGVRRVDRLFEPQKTDDWRQDQRGRWHGAVQRLQE